MQSQVLRISEMDVRNRLTVEHYISQHLLLMEQISQIDYPSVQLGQITEVRGGKRLPPNAQYVTDGIPYIRVVDVGDYRIEMSDAVYISSDLHRSIQRYQLKYKDIAIVIVGATIGKVAIFDAEVSPCNFNENMARISITDTQVNPEYLLAYLQSTTGQAYIKWLTGGAAQAKLSLERIETIVVPLPPRPIQDRIARVMQDAYATRRTKLAAAK